MAIVWHVYGRTRTEGELAGCWMTLALGLSVPQEMPYEWHGLPYLASFDHDPTEEEMEILRDAHEKAE